MTRGGKRIGSGRKPAAQEDRRLKTVSIKLSDREIASLKAEACGKPLRRLMREKILDGLDIERRPENARV